MQSSKYVFCAVKCSCHGKVGRKSAKRARRAATNDRNRIEFLLAAYHRKSLIDEEKDCDTKD